MPANSTVSKVTDVAMEGPRTTGHRLSYHGGGVREFCRVQPHHRHHHELRMVVSCTFSARAGIPSHGANAFSGNLGSMRGSQWGLWASTSAPLHLATRSTGYGGSSTVPNFAARF